MRSFNIPTFLQRVFSRRWSGCPRSLVRVGSTLAVLAALGAAPARADLPFPQFTTTTWLTAPGNSTEGQPATFTVQVKSAKSPQPSGGTVVFVDAKDLKELGQPVPLGNNGKAGQASVTVSSGLVLGKNHLIALYSGDPTDFPSITFPALGWVENPPPAATTTTLTSGTNPSVYGQPVLFTATVTSSAGGLAGTVSFFDGSTLLGTAALTSSGTANLTVPPNATSQALALAVGTHASITAQYGGDPTHAPSTSAPVSQVVDQATTTTTAPNNTANNSNSLLGAEVTFTVSVIPVTPGAGTPTGTVTFYDSSTAAPSPLGSAPLSGGMASFPTAALALGINQITAVYGGDTNFSGSTSAASTQTVTSPLPVTTSFRVPTNDSGTSVYGQSVTFGAAVAGSDPTPTGTVTFFDTTSSGTTPLGTTPLVNGSASFTTTNPLPVGQNIITTGYSGDSTYASILSANSPAFTQTVSMANTSTSVVVAGPTNPVDLSTPVSLTATVSVLAPGAGSPTGSVDFYNGTTKWGTGQLTGNTAGITIPPYTLAVGTYPITAHYSGDTNFNSSDDTTATQLSLVVNPPSPAAVTISVPALDPSVALNPGSGNPVYGENLVFDVTVTGDQPDLTTPPTGSVTFYDGTHPLGTQPLSSSGLASLPVRALSAGTHSITATYSGDTYYAQNTSLALAQVVDQAVTTISVSSSTNPSSVNSSVTFTAMLQTTAQQAPGTMVPSGSITFYDNGVPLPPVSLDTSSGQTLQGTYSVSTSPISSLAVGTHPITASYSGDGNYQASLPSPTLQQVVDPAAAVGTNTAITPPVTSPAGITPIDNTTTVTFTASVTPTSGSGTPAGTVTFSDDANDTFTSSSNSSTVPLSGGTAMASSSALTPGSRTVTATFTPTDPAAFTASSNSVSLTVLQATQTTVSFNPLQPVFGQPITLVATVSDAPSGQQIPTGSVTFFDENNNNLGTANLQTFKGGSVEASLPYSSFAAGPHTVTAIYNPGAGFEKSQATSSSFTVQIQTSTNITAPADQSTFNTTDSPFTVTAQVVPTVAGAVIPAGTITITTSTSVSGTSLSYGPYPLDSTGTAASDPIDPNLLLPAGETSDTISITVQYNPANSNFVASGSSITVNVLLSGGTGGGNGGGDGGGGGGSTL